MKEKWRDIRNYEGIYQVSTLGRVKRIDKKSARLKEGCYLKLSDHYKGYLTVKLLEKRFFVHKLVAQAFIGDRQVGCQINHKDCDKTNNVPSNLEYVTQKQNMTHAKKNGLRPSCKGKNNPFYGKKHSEESLKKMKSKIFSKKTREKMSSSAKIRAKREGLIKVRLMWRAKANANK